MWPIRHFDLIEIDNKEDVEEIEVDTEPGAVFKKHPPENQDITYTKNNGVRTHNMILEIKIHACPKIPFDNKPIRAQRRFFTRVPAPLRKIT